MRIRKLVAIGTERLKSSNSENPGQESRWLFMHASGLSAVHLISEFDEEVDPVHSERFSDFVSRRLLGEPFQYIVGHTEFRGIRLRVDPRVLIPRPETEQLVDIVMSTDVCEGPRILDVGTGSGCIAIALKTEWPSAEVVAIDCSQDALDVATTNAIAAGLDIETKLADILVDEGIATLGDFDIVVSNPPYVPADELEALDAEVIRNEPVLALSPGDDPLLFYRRLSELSTLILRPHGYLVVEIHSDFADDVRSIFELSGLSKIQVFCDMAESERVVIGQTAQSQSR